MPPWLTRGRLVLLVLLALALGAGAFAYFKYKRITGYIAGQLDERAALRLGRQVRFSGVSFSPLKGVVIKDACVSRRPDFTRGNFFCAGKVVVRPKLGALLRNQVRFSSVYMEKPVLKVREKGGAWDFEDLLALLPETDKGLYLTWNADELALRGATLEADMETSGLSLALENADLSLAHYSSYGGNYRLQASGDAKTVHGGKLVTAAAALKADLNFDYGGLASTSGSFALEEAGYGAAALDAFELKWKLFNMRKPLPEKNYSVEVSAEKLLVPALGGAAGARLSEAMALFARVMGRPAPPPVEDYEVSAFKAAFLLHESRLAVKDLEFRSNFIDLDASLAIDGPAKSADAALRAVIARDKIELSASGPLEKPAIKPLLSATLETKLKAALGALENSLLKLFPVTGEQHV